MRRHCLAVLWVFAAGCGYVGEPLPPLLNIPERVSDLTVVQRGANLVAQFTVPAVGTEGVKLPEAPKLTLRVDDRTYTDLPVADGRVRFAIPASPWTGREVRIDVEARNERGKSVGWSNPVSLMVVPAPQAPLDSAAEPTAAGIRLRWRSPASSFRIWRREGEGAWQAVGTAGKTEFLDAGVEFGHSYEYQVQALVAAGASQAESELSDVSSVLYEDRFPPAVPAKVAAVAAEKSIELAWEANTEPDAAGYRVYRAVADGPLTQVAETDVVPGYSDRSIEAGKKYRYAVSAVDKAGNESARSAVVEVTAQ